VKVFSEPVFAVCENGHRIFHSGRADQKRDSNIGKVEVPELCVRCNSKVVKIEEVTKQ
jgi:hypothetical protein